MPEAGAQPLTWEELRELLLVPTPSIANAIETFDVRPRNEGVSDGTIRRLFRERDRSLATPRRRPFDPTTLHRRGTLSPAGARSRISSAPRRRGSWSSRVSIPGSFANRLRNRRTRSRTRTLRDLEQVAEPL